MIEKLNSMRRTQMCFAGQHEDDIRWLRIVHYQNLSRSPKGYEEQQGNQYNDNYPSLPSGQIRH
jgi:hypothetical protein